jgi:hypothetical protein
VAGAAWIRAAARRDGCYISCDRLVDCDPRSVTLRWIRCGGVLRKATSAQKSSSESAKFCRARSALIAGGKLDREALAGDALNVSRRRRGFEAARRG